MGFSRKTGADVYEQRLAYVAAGSATNDTFYYYLPTQHYRKLGLQCEWTAGAGGGSITVTLEGSLQPMSYASTAADYSTLTYQAITNATFGVASWTDDFMAIDNTEKSACYSVIRVKVVVANKDDATTWTIYSRQVG